MAKNKVAKTEEEALAQIMGIVKDAAWKVAEEVTFRLQYEYEKSIERFYNDYKNPRYYDRTYSLYYGSTGALDWRDCIKETKDKKGIIAGIEVTRLGDDDNCFTPNLSSYRADDPSWVFTRAFESGIHGMTPVEVTEAAWLKPGKPTPFYRYYLHKKNGEPWQKEPMSNTPYEHMQKAYEKVYKQLDSLTKSELDKAFSRLG